MLSRPSCTQAAFYSNHFSHFIAIKSNYFLFSDWCKYQGKLSSSQPFKTVTILRTALGLHLMFTHRKYVRIDFERSTGCVIVLNRSWSAACYCTVIAVVPCNIDVIYYYVIIVFYCSVCSSNWSNQLRIVLCGKTLNAFIPRCFACRLRMIVSYVSHAKCSHWQQENYVYFGTTNTIEWFTVICKLFLCNLYCNSDTYVRAMIKR